MRPAPFFVILAFGFAAVAKEPASTPSFSERVTGKPDEKKEFNLEQHSPYGRTETSFRTKSANPNSFYFQQKFQAKGYDAKSFQTKNAWGGDFKFSTSDARTKPFQDTKAAPVKTAAVKEDRDADKTAATREFTPANKESNLKGRSQALFDKEGPAAQAKIGPSWSGNLKPLTVDDVREILNKNK